MRVARAHLVAAAAFLAAGLMAYAVTFRATRRTAPDTMLAFGQQTFRATRIVTTAGGTLHNLAAHTDGGVVKVNWYDSSLAPLGADSRVDATLLVDGQQIVSTVTGSVLGSAEKDPATLRWAGTLPDGTHHFQLMLTRIGAGVAVPYVPAGQIGVDSLVVSEQPGGG